MNMRICVLERSIDELIMLKESGMIARNMLDGSIRNMQDQYYKLTGRYYKPMKNSDENTYIKK